MIFKNHCFSRIASGHTNFWWSITAIKGLKLFNLWKIIRYIEAMFYAIICERVQAFQSKQSPYMLLSRKQT